MGKLLSLAAVATLLASLALPSKAGAATVEWEGKLVVQMPVAGKMPPFVHYGTGVATVNGSAGGIGHINTITLHHGLSFSGGNNVPETIPLTDPQIPTLPSVRATGLGLGTFTFSGISGGPPLGTKKTGRPPGQMKLCFFLVGCSAFLPFPFGTAGGTNAVGVGGMVTVNTFSKIPQGFRFSVWGAPWTIGLASIQNVTTETPNGGIRTYTATIQGFAHGPASATSSTAALSGVLQLVTPVRLESTMNPPDRFGAGWFQVTLRFIPEPGLLLLLGSGVGGLLLLGGSRMRGS